MERPTTTPPIIGPRFISVLWAAMGVVVVGVEVGKMVAELREFVAVGTWNIAPPLSVELLIAVVVDRLSGTIEPTIGASVVAVVDMIVTDSVNGRVIVVGDAEDAVVAICTVCIFDEAGIRLVTWSVEKGELALLGLTYQQTPRVGRVHSVYIHYRMETCCSYNIPQT